MRPVSSWQFPHKSTSLYSTAALNFFAFSLQLLFALHYQRRCMTWDWVGASPSSSFIPLFLLKSSYNAHPRVTTSGPQSEGEKLWRVMKQMNNKCGSVPCGARILGWAATLERMRSSLPWGHSPHSWTGANAARSQQINNRTIPSFLWSGQIRSCQGCLVFWSMFNAEG